MGRAQTRRSSLARRKQTITVTTIAGDRILLRISFLFFTESRNPHLRFQIRALFFPILATRGVLRTHPVQSAICSEFPRDVCWCRRRRGLPLASCRVVLFGWHRQRLSACAQSVPLTGNAGTVRSRSSTPRVHVLVAGAETCAPAGCTANEQSHATDRERRRTHKRRRSCSTAAGASAASRSLDAPPTSSLSALLAATHPLRSEAGAGGFT